MKTTIKTATIIPTINPAFDFEVENYPFSSSNNILQFNIDLLTPGNSTIFRQDNVSDSEFKIPLVEGFDQASVFVPLVVNIDGHSVPFTLDHDFHGSHTTLLFNFPSHKSSMTYDPIVFVPRRSCGNDVLDVGEECDWSDNIDDGCSSNCTCIPPYVPSGLVSCTLCGNGKIDLGEKCDGTVGCSGKCECEDGYTNEGTGCKILTTTTTTNPTTTTKVNPTITIINPTISDKTIVDTTPTTVNPTTSDTKITMNPVNENKSTTNTNPNAGLIVGIIVVIVIVVFIALAAIYILKKKPEIYNRVKALFFKKSEPVE